MANGKLLIDALHSEEVRVAVSRGNRVEEFDFESQERRPIRGNIYLAKITRVEPSLQAAFVDYGGNRHGFLPFGEIHPDYYQIPMADRQALLEEQAKARAKAEAEEEDSGEEPVRKASSRTRRRKRSARGEDGTEAEAQAEAGVEAEPSEADGSAPPSGRKRSRSRSRKAKPESSASEDEDASAAGAGAEGDAPDSGGDSEGGVGVEAEAPARGKRTRSGAGRKRVRKADSEDSPSADSASDEDGDGSPPSSMAARIDTPSISEEVRGDDDSDDRAESFSSAGVDSADSPESPDSSESPGSAESPDSSGSAEGDSPDSPESSGDSDPSASADSAEGDSSGRSARKRRSRSRKRKESARAEADGADEEDSDDSGAEAKSREDSPEEASASWIARRRYQIQEVIKRQQIVLVQVAKEERGNKGAALTTYLSLAGRYSILMPNTARGGGVSRKITQASDRKRLKGIASELEVPEGMGMIVRTAGAERTKAEIKRDLEYLMRVWESVRDLTLSSNAPELVYEEGNLVKRSIRDLYGREIDEVIVAGEEGYKEAKSFMKLLAPSHARNVKHHDGSQSLFAHYGVEEQLERLLLPEVKLKSGGSLIFDQTEALVSIDVNSGRSTRESSIEETALRTNLEAADEIARQLRLRDLAGLIVIDFIDMEEKQNNRSVERRLKDSLKNDRARIQMGSISAFGLLEMSRQRIRSSVMESTMETCPHCGGLGYVRSLHSMSLHVFRAIEDYVSRHPGNDVTASCPPAVAMELLNAMRSALLELERKNEVEIRISAGQGLTGSDFSINGTEWRSFPGRQAQEENGDGKGKKRRRGKRSGRKSNSEGLLPGELAPAESGPGGQDSESPDSEGAVPQESASGARGDRREAEAQGSAESSSGGGRSRKRRSAKASSGESNESASEENGSAESEAKPSAKRKPRSRKPRSEPMESSADSSASSSESTESALES